MTVIPDKDSAPRRILVLGATGGTGRLIVSKARARGHDVTALVRSPDKGQTLEGAKIVVGDALDPGKLKEAVRDQDVVISALGTPVSPIREVTLLSTATRALVHAMQAEQVSRLICITGLGAGDSAGHGGFLFDRLIMPLLLRNVYADKNRQEAIVRESGLDWTLVRPTVLNDKPERGAIRALTDLSEYHGGAIARADVANFVLDALHTASWRHRAPLITW
ncbi:NAD(P)-dependent oxidoreductase [Sphingomonas sp. ASY06-1R]|uniref:NAD(P)-dependent oxidoreductase n=1 Tax=Sphingomonas sp. ASY06-1R TaxID=3445771 RepID=UPI003FA31544